MVASLRPLIEHNGFYYLFVYDEFGNQIKTGEEDFLNEASYTGAVYDEEIGLYYMNARYYDCTTGQFISRDTYLGNAYNPWTQNLYTYTGNNPINYTDPTGHAMATIAAMVTNTAVGAVFGGINGAISAAISGDNIGDAFWSGVITGGISGFSGVFGVLASAVGGFVAGVTGYWLAEGMPWNGVSDPRAALWAGVESALWNIPAGKFTEIGAKNIGFNGLGWGEEFANAFLCTTGLTFTNLAYDLSLEHIDLDEDDFPLLSPTYIQSREDYWKDIYAQYNAQQTGGTVYGNYKWL